MTGEDLGLGHPPPWVQLKKAGRRVPWGLVVEPAEEGSPLAPLGLGPMEVDDAEQAPENSTMVGEAADEVTDTSLQPF